jgi:hypothetical protein
MALTRFRNGKAMILWIFGGVWISFLLLMTWELVTDGFPARGSPHLMLATTALFWVVGIGMTAYLASIPCVTVIVDTSFLQVTWRYPFRVQRGTYGRGQVERATVEVSKDSDGDPFFTARAAVSGERRVDFVESPEREECEAACNRFNEAFFGDSR